MTMLWRSLGELPKNSVACPSVLRRGEHGRLQQLSSMPPAESLDRKRTAGGTVLVMSMFASCRTQFGRNLRKTGNDESSRLVDRMGLKHSGRQPGWTGRQREIRRLHTPIITLRSSWNARRRQRRIVCASLWKWRLDRAKPLREGSLGCDLAIPGQIVG